MWLFALDGFFSIVQKPGQDVTNELTVRARTEADLRRFRARIPGRRLSYRIEATPDADYEFRLVAPRDIVQYVVAEILRELTYENFKHAVHDTGEHARASLYGRVWSVLLGLADRKEDTWPWTWPR